MIIAAAMIMSMSTNIAAAMSMATSTDIAMNTTILTATVTAAAVAAVMTMAEKKRSAH